MKTLIPDEMLTISSEYPDHFGVPGKIVMGRLHIKSGVSYIDKAVFEMSCKQAPSGAVDPKPFTEDINVVHLPAYGGKPEAYCYSIAELLENDSLPKDVQDNLRFTDFMLRQNYAGKINVKLH